MSSEAVTPLSTREALHAAVGMIQAQCDGAQSDDRVGFRKQDTDFGRRASMIPPSEWTDDLAAEVYRVLRVYRGQLERLGIDYDVLPEPAYTADATVHEARRFARETERKVENRSKRKVICEGDLLVFHAPYDADLIQAFRSLPGRRYRSADKSNTVPVSKVTRAHIEFTFHWGFAYGEDVESVFESALDPSSDSETEQDIPENPYRVELNGERAILRSPYNRDLVTDLQAFKSHGARYDRVDKVWTVPIEAPGFGALLERYGFEGRQAVIDRVGAKETEREERFNLSMAHDIDVDNLAIMQHLREYQKVGAYAAVRFRNVLIADDMGLGKTRQAISAAETAGCEKIVILCRAKLRSNWAREIRMLTGEEAFICSGRDGWYVNDHRYVVCNYDIAMDWLPFLQECDCLIVDESHYIKNPEANRTWITLEFGKKVNANDGMIIELTGTPIKNRPIELIPQLKLLGMIHEFGGEKNFKNRYCARVRPSGTDYFGSQNEEELQRRLRQLCMIRRKKDEVEVDLPSRSFETVELDLNGKLAQYRRAEEDFLNYLSAEKGTEAAMRAKRAEHITRINHLRKLVAKAKIDDAVEWCNDFLDRDDEPSLVVFAHHKEIQNELIQKLSKNHNVVSIQAGATDKMVDHAVTEFQNKRARVIVLSQEVGKEGLTLTAASDVLFVEQGWTPGDRNQGLDRTHRIGQTQPVVGYDLIAAKTVDEDILELIRAKQESIEKSTDSDTLGVENESIAGELIDRMSERAVSRNR